MPRGAFWCARAGRLTNFSRKAQDRRVIDLIRANVGAVVALVAAHQYVVLFAVIAIEEAGVPLPAPGDLVVAYFGDRARNEPAELVLVVLLCSLGSVVGTLAPYALARRFGPEGARRAGEWIDVAPDRVDRLLALISAHGFLTVFVGRLIPGSRVAISLVAGTMLMAPHHFSVAVLLAGLVYWSFWTAVGVVFGQAFRDFLGPAYVQYVLIALPLVFVAYGVLRHTRGRRRRARRIAAER